MAEKDNGWCSRNDPRIYMINRGSFCIGRLKDFAVPSDLRDLWDKNIRPKLDRSLQVAAQASTLARKKVMTEVVLCMAGRPSRAPSIGPDMYVRLKPWICIFCASSRWKSNVAKLCAGMQFLNDFVRDYVKEDVHVGLGAPWLAGPDEETSSMQGSVSYEPVSASDLESFFHPEVQFSQHLSLARYTLSEDNRSLEAVSTIGGILRVGHRLLGVTTAHGVGELLIREERGVERDPSTDPNHTVDEVEDQDDEDNGIYTPIGAIMGPSRWPVDALPSILAYCGRGTSAAAYDLPMKAPEGSDFVLVEMDALELLYSVLLMTSVVSSDQPSFDIGTELESGDVWVQTGTLGEHVKAHLLDTKSTIVCKHFIMNTRKIELMPGCRGYRGLSGSWVTREDGRVCGVVCAAYDHSPYLHMLPMSQVLGNVKEFLAAGQDDIEIAPLEYIIQSIKYMTGPESTAEFVDRFREKSQIGEGDLSAHLNRIGFFRQRETAGNEGPETGSQGQEEEDDDAAVSTTWQMY